VLRALGLTPHEAEMPYWITEGKTNPEISTILDTTLHTIKKHNNKLLAKLGVETRMAAARLAMSVLTNKFWRRDGRGNHALISRDVAPQNSLRAPELMELP
jgi:DNA-binding CsgD family transcriptional regulator